MQKSHLIMSNTTAKILQQTLNKKHHIQFKKTDKNINPDRITTKQTIYKNGFSTISHQSKLSLLLGSPHGSRLHYKSRSRSTGSGSLIIRMRWICLVCCCIFQKLLPWHYCCLTRLEFNVEPLPWRTASITLFGMTGLHEWIRVRELQSLKLFYVMGIV